jgi:hypothetical protein
LQPDLGLDLPDGDSKLLSNPTYLLIHLQIQTGLKSKGRTSQESSLPAATSKVHGLRCTTHTTHKSAQGN